MSAFAVKEPTPGSQPRWSRAIEQAYGLRLLSSDAARVPASEDGTLVLVRLHASPDWAVAAAVLRFEHPQRDPGGVPLLQWHDFGGGRHALRYADGCHFFLDGGERTVWARWPASMTHEDAATYLLGPVLCFFLRLSGKVCLHASVVMVGGRCVAFAGPAGAGKSTLAAALATLGDAVLTEDVACLDEGRGGFSVRPGYPLIRLWENSEKLLLQNGPLPLLTPNWDKRYLPLNGGRHRFHGTAEPLAAIYLLRNREPMAAPAHLAPLTGQDALARLLVSTHASDLLDRAMRTHEFEVLGRLSRTVPVHALTLNADGSRLMEAADWIRRQVAR
jgi:hypothetical protein